MKFTGFKVCDARFETPATVGPNEVGRIHGGCGIDRRDKLN